MDYESNNNTMNVHDDIQAERARRREHITKGFESDPIGESEALPEINLLKGEEGEPAPERDMNNPFEKAAAESDIEKSDIMRAFSGTDAITITKTGKEVKEQIRDKVLPKHIAKVEEIKSKLDGLAEKCGAGPTEEPPVYWMGEVHFDIPYKIYAWSQCYYNAPKTGMIGSVQITDSVQDGSKEAENPAKSAEQAKCREEYNETVRKYCETFADKKALEIMLDNLADGDRYKLTPRQAATLHFH